MAAKISVKGLAQFMTSGAAKQRSILRNHKFPKAAAILIAYYNEARNSIKQFHESNNDPAVLVRVVDDLRKKARGAKKQVVSRVDNNIRAIESYVKHFGSRKFVVLPTPKIRYSHKNVIVTATPDLLVEEHGQKEVIKLDCNKTSASDDEVQVMLQVFYEAGIAANLGVKPRNVIYLDSTREVPILGTKVKKSLKREVEAACENIDSLWDGINK